MPKHTSPERRHKTDLIVAAAASRGLTLYTSYRGVLGVGGGRWHVEASYANPGEQRPRGLEGFTSFQALTFEELLARFTDDVAWAGYLYGRQVLEPVQNEARVADYTEDHRRNDYADACADCRRYQWALDAGDAGYTVDGLTGAHDRIARAVVEFRAAWVTHREAARHLAALEAGVPTTPEAARSWLEEGCEYVTIPDES